MSALLVGGFATGYGVSCSGFQPPSLLRKDFAGMTQNGRCPNSNLVGSVSERGLLDSRLRGNDAGGVKFQCSPTYPF